MRSDPAISIAASNGRLSRGVGGRVVTGLGLVRAHHIILAALFATALVVGYLILPGERQRIAMLERDGKTREALSILERRFANGDRSTTTVYQMQELYLHFGNLKRSREMLEMMASKRPRDSDVQRRLANFYKQTQDSKAYVKALETRIELRYTVAACSEVIALSRQRGDFAAEQQALLACRQKGYRQTEDMVRLATLLASHNDVAQASQLLKSVDDVRRLRTDRDRQMLFALLIESDQPREAQRRAVRWLKGSKSDDFALQLVDMLTAANRFDDAVQLASEAGEPGSSLSLAVAELMLDRNELTAAETFLRGWLGEAKLDRGALASRFVAAALDAENPLLAYQGAVKHGLTNLDGADLVALAEALGAIGLQSEFDAVRKTLTAEQLAQNPLLGAAVQLSSGAPAQSRALLNQVRVDQLDEWRLALWARLTEQTGPAATVPSAQTPPAVATRPPITRPRTIRRDRSGARPSYRRAAPQVAKPAETPAAVPPFESRGPAN